MEIKSPKLCPINRRESRGKPFLNKSTPCMVVDEMPLQRKKDVNLFKRSGGGGGGGGAKKSGIQLFCRFSQLYFTSSPIL